MTARRALAALLLGLLAGLCVPAISGAKAQAPAPGVEFVAALQDASTQLGGGDVAPASDPHVQRARLSVQHAGALAISGSAALAPIIDDLSRDPADVADARTRLRTLLDALALPANSVAEDPKAAQNTLHDVYKQDTFANLDSSPSGDGIFTRIGRALLDALNWLTSHTVGALGAVPTLVIAGLILAVIVFFVVRRLQQAGVRGEADVRAEPQPRSIDADAEWRLAADAAARADYREAVRHAFRSALLAAAQRGRLQVDAAWTTSELLTRARGDADLVAALAPAAASFDHAWYSGRAVTQQDWEVARERCEAVRHLAGRRVSA